MAGMKLSDVKEALANGGYVRFYWGHSEAEQVYSENGRRLGIMDGRSYQGFLRTVAPTLNRVEVGSTEERNLVITWKQHG
jgi:hypothetical protein